MRKNNCSVCEKSIRKSKTQYIEKEMYCRVCYDDKMCDEEETEECFYCGEVEYGTTLQDRYSTEVCYDCMDKRNIHHCDDCAYIVQPEDMKTKRIDENGNARGICKRCSPPEDIEIDVYAYIEGITNGTIS